MKSKEFAIVNGIGKLVYRTVYAYYDEPLLFSCNSQTGSLYVLLRLASDEPDWIAVEASSDRLHKLEINDIELRTFFTKPESGYVYRVSGVCSPFVMNVVNPSELTDDMLPYAGEYLDYDADENDEEDATIQMAANDNCAVINISLEEHDSHDFCISSEALSDVLEKLQLMMFAAADRNGKSRGKFPNEIRENNRLLVTEFYAASFGLRLKTKSFENEDELNKTNDALRVVDSLLRSRGEGNAIKEVMKDANSRTANYYSKLLDGLRRHNVGFAYSAASPSNVYHRLHMTSDEIGEAIYSIENHVKNIEREEEYKGKLKGLDFEKKSFSFVPESEDENELIKGSIDTERVNGSYLVPGKALIKVKTTLTFDKRKNRESYSYKLIDIKDNR